MRNSAVKRAPVAGIAENEQTSAPEAVKDNPQALKETAKKENVYATANCGHTDEQLIALGFVKKESIKNPGVFKWIRTCPNCIKYLVAPMTFNGRAYEEGDVDPRCIPGRIKVIARLNTSSARQGDVAYKQCYQCVELKNVGIQTAADYTRSQRYNAYKDEQAAARRDHLQQMFGKQQPKAMAAAAGAGNTFSDGRPVSDEDVPF